MDKNTKFIEAYLSIINEDADKKYHNIREIATAVKTTTNNCQDLWIKGQSGQAVLNYLNAPPENPLFVSDFELKYIANYWNGKAKSGNKFDTDMASEIGRAVSETLNNERFPHAFLRFKIGIIAYGIWKALNVKQKKEANNRAEIENSNVDQEYANISNKKLKLVDWKLEMGVRGYFSLPCAWTFICRDDNNFKVVIKVKESDRVGCGIIEAMNKAQDLEISKEEIISKFGMNEIVIAKATLGRINKEYKTIYLNRVAIQYPSNLSSVEEVEKMKQQIDDEIKANEEAKELDRANSENSHWKIVEMICDNVKTKEFKEEMTKEQQFRMLNSMINTILKNKIKDKSENIKSAIKEDLIDAFKEAFPNNYQEYIDVISF